MSSDSESQLFITQAVLADWGTAIEPSKNNFEFSFMGADNEQLTFSIFAPRIF